MQFSGMMYRKWREEGAMSKNKKMILLCVVALAAIAVFLGIQGGKTSKTTDVVRRGETMSDPQKETPVVEMPPEESMDVKATNEPVAEDKKTSKRSDKETKSEKKEKSDAGVDSSDQTDQKDSSTDKKSGKSKTKKSKNQDSATPSKQKVNHEKEPSKAETPQQVTPEPEQVVVTPSPKKNQCKLTITCTTVFDHMGQLKDSAKKVIPKNGIFLQGSFELQEGDTAFDVLKRACEKNNILLDYVFTPMYSTYYIKGIGNLYEFDCGAESGWLYTINGQNPGYGCSQYKLSGEEEVVFYYSCEK